MIYKKWMGTLWYTVHNNASLTSQETMALAAMAQWLDTIAGNDTDFIPMVVTIG